MELLWPDKAPEKGRHSLSQTLYELRRELGDGWIEVHGETLRSGASLSTDVGDFLSATEAGADADALALYRGGFLEGINLATGRNFEGWVDRIRSRLAREHRKAAARLLATKETAGDVAGALAVARAWVEADPLDDEGQHQLIALLARAGRRSAALRQYDRYAALLERELEIEPLEETRDLVARIRLENLPEPQGEAPTTVDDGAGQASDDLVPERPGSAHATPPPEAGTDPPPPASPTPPGERDGPRTALEALIEFADELSRRRVNRVAVGYLVAAFAMLEGADLLLSPLGAPSWVQTALSVTVLLGFPVVLAVAWVFDITPRGLEMTEPLSGRGASATRLARRGLFAVVAVSIAGLVGIWAFRRTMEAPVFDVNRVMVFPLVTPAGNSPVQASVGEDVATMIGHALDRTGPLRWIDGWALLQPEERNDIRELTNEEARALAAVRSCAYYVRGRIVSLGDSDSTTVFLDLWDAAGDSALASSQSTGPGAETWQTGMRAVGGLLPFVVGGETPPDFGQEVLGREPAAVASFLLGERALRRARGQPALGHYQAAVSEDSLFALAALRGAQAAAWVHDYGAMSELARRALGLTLTEADRHLAVGLLAYSGGRADSATAAFDRAIALDDDNPVAWLQKGEVHVHLAPRTRRPDSVAAYAFERAFELQPDAVHTTFHPVVEALVRGDLQTARPMRDALLAASPEEAVVKELDIVGRCARRPMAVDEWGQLIDDDGLGVLHAARHFAGAARNPPCAEAAFRAVLLSEAEISNANRRAAMLGLQAMLLNGGREAEALALLDAASRSLRAVQVLVRDPAATQGYPAPGAPSDTLFVTDPGLFATPNPLDNAVPAYVLIQAAKGVELGDRPTRVMDLMYELLGRDFSRASPNNLALYRVGIFAIHQGDLDEADRVLTVMNANADTLDWDLQEPLATAVSGHLALARGDTTLALARLSSLRTEGQERLIAYGYTDPLPFERVVESRLWLARGTRAGAQAAYDLASSLDGAPLGYTLFLAESLDLRIEAADALGLPALANELRARRASLAVAALEVDG